MSRRVVAVVFGGRSPEHDVSLDSARFIVDNLDDARHELLLVGVDRKGVPRIGDAGLLSGGLDRDEGTPVRWPASPEDRTLRAERTGEAMTAPVDCVFPIVHGPGGEDGTLQGVCELAGIACVGAGVLGSAIAMDKAVSRQLLKARGFPVIETLVLSGQEICSPEHAAEKASPLGLPVFVKPARAGSSIGITKVKRRSELAGAIRTALEIDDKILIERAVRDPREIEVSVLGLDDPRASVPGEVVPHGEFYSYAAKYEDAESRLLIPAPIDEELAERIRVLAVNAFRALCLAGMARVDFLLAQGDGRLILNEVNTLPGFTKISMYPRLWQASGVEAGELLGTLVDLAFESLRRGPLAIR